MPYVLASLSASLMRPKRRQSVSTSSALLSGPPVPSLSLDSGPGVPVHQQSSPALLQSRTRSPLQLNKSISLIAPNMSEGLEDSLSETGSDS